MNRLSLRWIILIPLLATITLGFVVFAVYIVQSDRSTRLAIIDQELIRAERIGISGSSNSPSDGETPQTPSPGPDLSEAGIDPPVQLMVTSDGEIAASQGADNPFSRDTLVALGSAGEATTIEVGDYRVRVSPHDDGQVQVTALSLRGYHVLNDTLADHGEVGWRHPG